MSTSKDEKYVPTRERWAPPPDYVALTSEEYLVQQKYIRDKANEELVSRLDAGTFKGTASLQRMAIDAAAEVDRVENTVRPAEGYDSLAIGFELDLPIPSTGVEA